MPNWCNTHITFYAENKENVVDLRSKLMQYTAVPCNGCKDATWLGNILLHAKIGTLDEILADKYGYCRGWVDDIGDVEQADGYYSFYITVQDAWAPHTEPFYHLLGKLYNHVVKMAYAGEEPGCEVYLKYDPDNLFYADCEYAVDSYIPAECAAQYADIADMDGLQSLDNLCEAFHADNWQDVTAKADEITDTLQDEYGDGYVYVHEYEVMDNPF